MIWAHIHDWLFKNKRKFYLSLNTPTEGHFQEFKAVCYALQAAECIEPNNIYHDFGRAETVLVFGKAIYAGWVVVDLASSVRFLKPRVTESFGKAVDCDYLRLADNVNCYCYGD